ncbi:MAG TPA: glycosyltransferase [Candidatus Limnocylindrales bacterium]|nr:glycosyltransferase [Candidatus Limnocylindrales bacterium]
MRILSVAYPLAIVGPEATGGAERVLTEIDSVLGDRSIVIAAEGSQVAGTLIATPRVKGAFTREARSWAQANHRTAIASALHRYDVDLVHFHGIDFLTYLPSSGPAMLATLHLPPSWYPPRVFDLPVTLNAVSRAQQSACPRFVPVIENGVSIRPARVSKRNFALALGRICPEKGLHIAIEAAQLAGVPLILAGELYPYPEHEHYFQTEILPRLGRNVRYAGPVTGVRKTRLLTAARCLLAPSLAQETSSLVAMEALTCGTPVIAYPNGALPEIATRLVSTPLEMAEAIRTVRPVTPQSNFTASQMTQKYLELYRDLTGSVRRREGSHLGTCSQSRN